MTIRALPLPENLSEITGEITGLIDIHRGEMDRFEFARLLIRNRLEQSLHEVSPDDEAAAYTFVKDVLDLLGDFLEIMCQAKLASGLNMPWERQARRTSAFPN